VLVHRSVLLSAVLAAASVSVLAAQPVVAAPASGYGAAGDAMKRDGPLLPAACTNNLAERLKTTEGAGQLVTVGAANFQTSDAEVTLWQRKGPCWELAAGPWAGLIGENGFSNHHREGDGTTPTGIYRFGPVVYGNAPNPGFRGRYHHLVCGDWWDEDPASAGYNTFQHVPCGQSPPFGGDSEALWRETNYYPSLAFIEYNAHPAVPYAGSAIFLHADTGTATTGCVSIPLGELNEFLRWLDPARLPTIAMAPTGELASF
jgi:L,D-peptidoglycan transpeptidase YkuD (ErfK/YbiS/YcfS/YnhG family)